MSSAVVTDNNIMTVSLSTVASGGTVDMTFVLTGLAGALVVDGGSLSSTGEVGDPMDGCTENNAGLVWGGTGTQGAGESTITWTAPSDAGVYNLYAASAPRFGEVKRGIYTITVTAAAPSVPTTAPAPSAPAPSADPTIAVDSSKEIDSVPTTAVDSSAGRMGTIMTVMFVLVVGLLKL